MKVDQPDLRLNPKVTLRPTTPMPQAEPTRSQRPLYDNGPLDQTNTKANNFAQSFNAMAPGRASEQKEGGRGETRGEEKKEKREWRAGEKTTLTALLDACSAIAERSGARLSEQRQAGAGSVLMRKSSACEDR